MLGKIRTANSEFLASWPWQWFAHLTLHYQAKESHLEKMGIRWARDIAKAERIQVAHIGVINSLRHPHIHLLMLGRSADGKSLLHAHRLKAERHWPGNAQIAPITLEKGGVNGAADYVSRNMPHCNHQLIFYNVKLLNKLRAS